MVKKPRSNGEDWKGLMYDPGLDGSNNIVEGIKTSYKLMMDVLKIGLPIASEALDPVLQSYIGHLVSYMTIGARTVQSQTHKQIASGAAGVVGVKHPLDGDISIAAATIKTAQSPTVLTGVNTASLAAAYDTKGNMGAHLILRGTDTGSNYDAESVQAAIAVLEEKGLHRVPIVIDCAHGNAWPKKDYNMQPKAYEAALDQIAADPAGPVRGVGIEMHLHEGNQSIKDIPLCKGVSITDPCVSLETYEKMLDYGKQVLTK
ncbi:MAG: 3-deoxy-7-phosphoheptulonate synthase [Candidatus Woesearchaeota archaeon]|jgi:3-deoxy-7-phosphoheptulonate synthase